MKHVERFIDDMDRGLFSYHALACAMDSLVALYGLQHRRVWSIYDSRPTEMVRHKRVYDRTASNYGRYVQYLLDAVNLYRRWCNEKGYEWEA